jgi:hypothetical protein
MTSVPRYLARGLDVRTGERVVEAHVRDGAWEVGVAGVVESVNVGTPREISWRGQTVRTAIWKDPVPGRVRVGEHVAEHYFQPVGRKAATSS